LLNPDPETVRVTEPTDGEPLVSIGIPTYNRAELLARSVESALAQDHHHVEVLVSDNASTDGTVAVARGLATADPRVRVLTSPENLGPAANFNRLRAEATGRYFMWLGDDDWLDPDYVSTCLAAIFADPEVVLAAGRVLYHGPDGEPWPGVPDEPRSPDASRRVLEFWRTVRDNGPFYGLVPIEVSRALPPLANAMGNDMHHMSGVAFLGRSRIVETTTVHRAVGGATRSLKHAARVADQPWWQGELPQLAIAWFALRDIGWASPVYRSLSRSARLVLATRAAFTILRRFLPEAVPKYVRVLRGRVRSLGRRGGPT
jgi:glycosyltransferase involved in cell wall biosynthesis